MAYYHENLSDAKREINNYLSGKEYDRALLESISSNENGGTELGNILEVFSQVHTKASPPNNCCREAVELTKKLIDLIK